MADVLTMYQNKEDAMNGVNALIVPTPSYQSARQTLSTLVNSGRSALNGELYAQRVNERDLSKIEITWKYLTATEWSKILTQISNGDEGFYVWIKYFDMQTNGWKCRQFYPSDRSATPFRLDKETKAVLSWLDCSVNFIDTGREEIEL